jgi:Cft2 family RNA processing exonuclease
MISLRYDRGLHLPEHALWLDPQTRQPLAFVSHAHSDHLAAHAGIVAHPSTARFMRERLRGARQEHLPEFGERREFRDCAITLLPAGHILGSAQAFVESAAGTLLYTGDFKLRPGLAAEPAGWRHADTLIMETTFGLPKYCMPPTADVLAQIIAFCRAALDDGAVPMLLAYSLGKAQEAIHALLRAGLAPMLHEAVFRMTEIHRELSPSFPAGYVRFSKKDAAGKVLVWPPNARQSALLADGTKLRTAVLSGWALDPRAIYRYRCDAAFPLTDHADYPDLVRYVELVQPRRVFTLHGFAADFAADLRRRGVEAWALTEDDQLELHLPERTSPASGG